VRRESHEIARDSRAVILTLIATVLIPSSVGIIWRLLDEEKILGKNLAGYAIRVVSEQHCT